MAQLRAQAAVDLLELFEVAGTRGRKQAEGDEQIPFPFLPRAVGDQLFEQKAGGARQGKEANPYPGSPFPLPRIRASWLRTP